jgi:hypothetical protein
MPKLSLAKLERHLYSAADRLRQEEMLRNKASLLKSGLMNDLLTGRVRVPEGIAAKG